MGDSVEPEVEGSQLDDPANLASAVFEEESKRLAEQEAKSEVVVLPDDLLPGVGEAPMTLRQGIRAGGASMLVVLFLLNVIDEFDRVAIAVLLPDLQDAFGVSDTVILGISSFGGVALVLGAVPLAWLADRVKRTLIVPVATAGWAVSVFLTGLVRNPFQYFWTRVLTGAGQANRLPVHSSLLTDTYPIPARARIFAFEGMGRPIGLLIGPVLAGAIASIAGGDDGWRWAFYIFAIPPVVLALVSLLLKEPPRAGNEQQAILGEQFEMPPIGSDLPVSMSTAFARLKKVKTFYFLAVGVGTLGFALVTLPSQLNLMLEDEYGYEAFQRGWVTSLVWLASLVAIPISGFKFDGMFREDPSKMVRTAGTLIVTSGLLVLIAMRFHQPAIMIFGISLANACTSASFVAAAPTIGAVAPYRMRAQAFALLPVFIFLMGGFMGSIIAGSISDAHGERLAISIVAPPASIIGGLLVAYGSRYIKRDISLAVSELVEEQEEMRRMAEHPDDIPVLQVRGLDYSYGPVQVLFDCGLEVRRGETLALLGTNGAGKSTLLAGGQRARSARPRRHSAQRAHHHLRRRRTAVQAGHRASAGRFGSVPRPHGGGEPLGHHAEHQRREGRDLSANRTGIRRVRRIAGEAQPGCWRPLRGPAADAGFRYGPDARARGASHRRTVSGLGPGGGAGAAGGGGAAEGDGADHDHRGAVAQRGSQRGRAGRCSWRRAGFASKVRRRNWPSGTTWCGRCSWARRAAEHASG